MRDAIIKKLSERPFRFIALSHVSPLQDGHANGKPHDGHARKFELCAARRNEMIVKRNQVNVQNVDYTVYA